MEKICRQKKNVNYTVNALKIVHTVNNVQKMSYYVVSQSECDLINNNCNLCLSSMVDENERRAIL